MSYLSRLLRRAAVSRVMTSLALPKGIVPRGSVYREEAPIDEETIVAPMRRSDETPVRRMEETLPEELEVVRSTSTAPAPNPTTVSSSTTDNNLSPPAMRIPEDEEEEKLLTVRREEMEEKEEDSQAVRRQETEEEEELMARREPVSLIERNYTRAASANRTTLFREESLEVSEEETSLDVQPLKREARSEPTPDNPNSHHASDTKPERFSAELAPVAEHLGGIPFHEPFPMVESATAASPQPQSEVVIERLDVLIHEPAQAVSQARTGHTQINRAMRARYLRRL